MTTANNADDQPVPDVIPEPPEDAAQIPPEGLERVAWLLRRIGELDAAHEPDERLHHAERERIDGWIEQRRRTHEAKRSWYTNEVEGWHRAELARNPKAKTVSTPYGTSRIRTSSPRAVPADDALLAEWVAENHPDALTRKVNISEWRRHVDVKNDKVVDCKTGEVVPGAKVHTPEPSWSASIDNGEPF